MKRPYCDNCGYIGDPKDCSCMWTLRRVIEGKGAEPEVIQNAKAIVERAEA